MTNFVLSINYYFTECVMLQMKAMNGISYDCEGCSYNSNDTMVTTHTGGNWPGGNKQ